MTRAQKNLFRTAAVIAGQLPALALAHPGHGETTSFVAGALHPVGGVEHILAFITVGLLAGILGGRYLAPLTAAFLGLLVSAWTAESDGWQYAAGFMAAGATLIAAGVAAIRLCSLALTAVARRSPT